MAKPSPGGRRPRKRERKNVTHAVALATARGMILATGVLPKY